MESRLRKNRDIWIKNFLILFFSVNLQAENLTGKTVIADQTMVVTRHYLASEVGNQVLTKGGNAIDAAVAVSFALAVVLPQAGNIGGGGFMIFYNKEDDNVYSLDYREMAPLNATEDMFMIEGKRSRELALESYLSSGTPGTVHGMYEIHKKFGKLSWEVLIDPSIKLASEGFRVTNELAQALKSEQVKLGKSNNTKKIFFKNEEPLKKDDLLVQTDLANTLKLIAIYGRDGFYKGETAKKIALDMSSNGGLITEKDLSEYHSKLRDPIVFNYKNLKIASMPPPSSGGLLLGLMLNMLENFNLSDSPNDVNNILIISEIMQVAFSLRAKYIGDEDFYPVPIENFLSEDIAAELSKNVNTKRTSKNSEINNTNVIFKENTTHFSIIDKYGNAVSNTTTLNTGFGSGIVIKDTGILMNNEMDDFSSAPGVENYFSLLGSEANKIEPKKRPLSSMTPTIVFEDDEVRLITGAQGGGRIITAVLQIIINYFEYKLGPELSVSTNRYHHQWFPEKLYYENFDEKTLHELKKLGFELEKRELEDYYSNGITSTIIIEGDKIIGISDPRLDDYSSAGSSAD